MNGGLTFRLSRVSSWTLLLALPSWCRIYCVCWWPDWWRLARWGAAVALSLWPPSGGAEHEPTCHFTADTCRCVQLGNLTTFTPLTICKMAHGIEGKSHFRPWNWISLMEFLSIEYQLVSLCDFGFLSVLVLECLFNIMLIGSVGDGDRDVLLSLEDAFWVCLLRNKKTIFCIEFNLWYKFTLL